MKLTARAAALFYRLPPARQGMLWMAAGALLLTCMAAVIKSLAGAVHPFEIVLFRAVFGTILMAPLMLRHGLADLRTPRLGTYMMRGVFTVTAGAASFWAFQLIPLAEATAIVFSRPLFATVIAIIFLGEVVGARRWAATAVGFIGMLIMVRPGIEEISPGVVLALVGAVFAACSANAGRSLGRTEPANRMTFYFMAVQLPLAAIPAALVWHTPSWSELGLLLFMGVLGTIGQLAINRAFRAAEVSVLLPLDFLRLIYAAILGFALFGNVPQVWTWVGGGIIFAAVIYIGRREAAARRAGGVPPAAVNG